jgi:hypothetical protein
MPFLAAVIVISLGIGIGVNTIVFSWIQARVLKPLPRFRIGKLSARRATRGKRHVSGLLLVEYKDLRANCAVSRVARVPDGAATGESGQVERHTGSSSPTTISPRSASSRRSGDSSIPARSHNRGAP